MKRYLVFRRLSNKSKAKVFIIDFTGWDSKIRAKAHAKRLHDLFPDVKFTIQKARF